MIRYDLRCNNEHVFEGWFADMAAYDTQSANGELACPTCGSIKVGKALMAPNLGRKSANKESSRAAMAAMGQLEMRRYLQQVRKQIEANSEHLGDKFPEEARRIHHGEAKERNIYGDATKQQVEELRDEGIEIAAIPWVDPDN